MSLRLDERRLAILAEFGIHHVVPGAAGEAALEDADAAVDAFADEEAVRAAPVTTMATAVETARASGPAATVSVSPAARDAVRILPAEIAALDWAGLQSAVTDCRACTLCNDRSKAVFGTGSTQADWLVVGDSPAETTGADGEPFAGAAAQLLDNMLRAVGASRARNAFITNALKCRPPAGRNPTPEEVAHCEPLLRRQVELLRPKVILAVGRFAVQTLLATDEPPGRLRGRAHDFHGVPVVVTYPPAYLLRTPADKGKAWADLCLALEIAAGP